MDKVKDMQGLIRIIFDDYIGNAYVGCYTRVRLIKNGKELLADEAWNESPREIRLWWD